MRKQIITAVLALTLGLGALSALGCTHTAAKEDINANIPAGAPGLMPASHEGRFELLGANGCYGCHGASERSNPMLKDAVALPENHYLNSTSSSYEIDPVRDQCNTCHAQS